MLSDSLKKKLEAIAYRYIEIGGLLSDASVITNQTRYRELSQEYASVEPTAKAWQDYQENLQAKAEAETMRGESDDPDMKALAEEEIVDLNASLNSLSEQLLVLLLPKDPLDDANIFLEIRAGTGGDEASLFAGDLFRMYTRFAEIQKWQYTVVSAHEGDKGGFKEVIVRIAGQGVYSQLKFESGAHRVQRVPATESQGRVHTSACTVAILPESDTIEAVEINSADLRVDTFRASGAGGQHVNKTDSAIRLTHLPTGVVVECQDERSQHKNRARAMSLLQARLLSQQQQSQKAEEDALRRGMVGSGDRSERIRTYNFPQGRVTDHRINLTLYQLDDVMEGVMAPVIGPLIRELKAGQMAKLGADA